MHSMDGCRGKPEQWRTRQVAPTTPDGEGCSCSERQASPTCAHRGGTYAVSVPNAAACSCEPVRPARPPFEALRRTRTCKSSSGRRWSPARPGVEALRTKLEAEQQRATLVARSSRCRCAAREPVRAAAGDAGRPPVEALRHARTRKSSNGRHWSPARRGCAAALVLHGI